MAIISPLTYTIQDGQAVDATPVMANLNQIVANVNANAAGLSQSNTFANATVFQSTVQVDGELTATNGAVISGATQINNTLAVSGATQINNTLAVSGATQINNTLVVSGATQINSTLAVSGTLTTATGATAGTSQVPQAQQLANDSLPIHATSAPGATSFAMRNRIINGNFQINQRSYTSGSATPSGSYMHDRWKAGASGCTYTFTQAANGQQITITAGSLEQVIENASVEGGEYTLSWSGTAQGSVNGGASAASPITVSGLAASTAVTVSFGTGTLGNVQFEPGPTATPFEQRPVGMELALCQRYFATVGSASPEILYVPAPAATYTNTYRVTFPQQMRATPTFNYTITSSTAVSSYGVASSGPNFIVMSATANAATNAVLEFVWNASAEL